MTPVLETLFGSQARVRVLALFLQHAGSEYYLREIAQKTGLAVRSVQRVVEALVEVGLLERERRGNSVYFRLDDGFPILPELKAMFLKTVGLSAALQTLLERVGGIEAAFIYGSVAKGGETAESDIDLAVVGSISPRRVTAELASLERNLGRETNATVFTSDEWRTRRTHKDHFVTTLLREPKIMLVGSAKGLED
jgi:predicted nucleotidyltransferase